MRINLVFLFLIFMFCSSVYSQVKQVEINWGDSSPTMVIKASETFYDMKINTDGGEQKIFYHPSWMVSGKLIHWLDSQKKPQHRFNNSGTFTIKYVETDINGVQTIEQGNITIPSTGTNDLLRAAPNIAEPTMYYPVIKNAAGQDFVVPDVSTRFISNFSMASLPASNYIIKEVLWELIPPWKINGDLKSGYKVQYDDFVVPSSSMNVTDVETIDQFQNTINFKIIFSYKDPSATMTSLGGGPIQATTFIDYFAAPPKPYAIPVMDVIPVDDDYNNLPAGYFKFEVPPIINTGSMTGDLLPSGIKIEVKDENPNLILVNLQSDIYLMPPGILPDQVNKRITTIAWGNPSDFTRFPQSGTTATGRNDYYSKSLWKTTNSTNLQYPYHYKGRAVVWDRISGFGPGKPYLEGPEIIIRDNDPPNIIVHLFDMFQGKVHNDVYITDKDIPIDPKDIASFLEKIDPNDETLYKYIDYNSYDATAAWENETPVGKFNEDTRIFGEIYVIDNVNDINGTPVKKYKHINNVKYHIVKTGSSNKLVNEEIKFTDDIKSEKIGISPFLLRKPGAYDFVITVEDRAAYDENGTLQNDLSMSSVTGNDNNIRIFTLKLNISDIQQRTNSLNKTKGTRY